MKGQIDKNMLVIMVLLVIVAAISIMFLLKPFGILTNTTTSNEKVHTECAKWISQNPPCGIDLQNTENPLHLYPTLDNLYKKDVESAKKVCLCP